MWRKFSFLFVCILLLAVFSIKSDAFSRPTHDEYMLNILFKTKNENAKTDPKYTDILNALEDASYLTIDSFNSSGQNELNRLKQFGVKRIPSSIDEITYSEWGPKHRAKTHRGWDYVAPDMKEKWPARKKIMINTVGTIFDFKGDYDKQESFCELIYYTHILADHIYDEDLSSRNNSGLKVEVGGTKDNHDIVSELIKCSKILFADQKYSFKYNYYLAVLNRYNEKCSSIIGSVGGIDTEEEFAKYHKYAEDLYNTLCKYIPSLLKGEDFFTDVFY